MTDGRVAQCPFPSDLSQASGLSASVAEVPRQGIGRRYSLAAVSMPSTDRRIVPVEEVQPHQGFVNAVRSRLDLILSEAGFPFNGVYPGTSSHGEAETTAVLYEAAALEFAARFPLLTERWAPDWAEHTSCVDLWLTLSHHDEAMTVNLEGWDLVELAEHHGDYELVAACNRALSGPGDLVERVDVIGRVLELALG